MEEEQVERRYDAAWRQPGCFRQTPAAVFLSTQTPAATIFNFWQFTPG